MIESPSLRDSGISYIVDVSTKNHAARQETQRVVRADLCLSDALASVRKALDEINSERRMTVADEGFLLIEDDEDETLQDQSKPPAPGYEEAAARLRAIFAQR
jgi:hypothetical protein